MKTPKEEANLLVNSMLNQIEYNCQPSINKLIAKACALVAIQKLIDELYYLSDVGSPVVDSRDHYEQVKKEIEEI